MRSAAPTSSLPRMERFVGLGVAELRRLRTHGQGNAASREALPIFSMARDMSLPQSGSCSHHTRSSATSQPSFAICLSFAAVMGPCRCLFRR